MCALPAYLWEDLVRGRLPENGQVAGVTARRPRDAPRWMRADSSRASGGKDAEKTTGRLGSRQRTGSVSRDGEEMSVLYTQQPQRQGL